MHPLPADLWKCQTCGSALPVDFVLRFIQQKTKGKQEARSDRQLALAQCGEPNATAGAPAARNAPCLNLSNAPLYGPSLAPLPAEAAALGKPLIVEEFGAEQNRDAYFKGVFSAVEASLKSGGALKGGMFWQFYLPGQVGGGVAALRCAAAVPCRAPCRLLPAALTLPCQHHTPPGVHLCMQTASAGEGGGAGRFGIYPSDSTFFLIKANAAAVQQLYSGPAPSGTCSKKGPAAEGACANTGCGAGGMAAASTGACTQRAAGVSMLGLLNANVLLPLPHPAALPCTGLRALAVTSMSTSV